ncbi:MAG: hypothetical protein JSV56_11420 [Methanomassiliicoccales archaeon]|jgi:hypothetical protein|nr:MAG: hypothetical protein JSV56_11420 [Methanomassiliicoccales archaeon]
MVRDTKYKRYRNGDQIHISVTKDFADTATEFFRFCRELGYNPSEVMRGAIADWLEKQKEIQRIYKESQMEKSDMLGKVIESYERSVLYEE